MERSRFSDEQVLAIVKEGEDVGSVPPAACGAYNSGRLTHDASASTAVPAAVSA
jgi:hypothetical protein